MLHPGTRRPEAEKKRKFRVSEQDEIHVGAAKVAGRSRNGEWEDDPGAAAVWDLLAFHWIRAWEASGAQRTGETKDRKKFWKQLIIRIKHSGPNDCKRVTFRRKPQAKPVEANIGKPDKKKTKTAYQAKGQRSDSALGVFSDKFFGSGLPIAWTEAGSADPG